ncbi:MULTISPECIES: hypothetical protein [unclassified Thiomonas]|jgi:hypothetical protein|nr:MULTISPECIES: hypothetical protein [unclassified Thiomonas]CQR44812.1 conserved hypothetical protein [Thiomonas sp. CB3]SCC91890.1 conserved hypothetical protein [Thiomonas sp. X19]CDW92584.1 conserved hypothetical protein [Thiomonas sp. CB2]VDY05711.1 conserved protein of unknown function [Thiomonas sp. Bio17B3]VDY07124.1 conserved protein of unknown function [Thiomonas sp. Sup16B3]
MAYSNSEQVFMDVLGRLPTEDEWKDVRSLLGILQRTGFEVDDPSNAPHVTLFAWGWARSTPRADVLAAVKAAVLESGKAEASPVDLTPVIAGLRGLQEVAARPVSAKVDEGVVRTAVREAVTSALREPISLASMALLGVVIAVALFVGSWWGKRQLEPTVQMQQQMIQKLTAPDHAPRAGK